MATSTTFAFNLDIGEIVDEAYDRCGLEARSGYDYKTARRSLNLLMLEWQNRGLNLFTLKEASQSLTIGTGDYALSAEKLDVIEAVYRTNAGDTGQLDRSLRRISMSEYSHKATKLTRSPPTVFAISKDPSQITIKLWPVPDAAATLTYWYLERIEDVGSVASNNMDIPPRFLPPLNAGLAYMVGTKNTDKITETKLQSLFLEYERQFDLATRADREKSSLRLVPHIP